MEKINIAELLKNCPKGMELDCTAFNNVKFQCADNDGIWIEYIDSDNNDRVIYLTCDGGIKIKNIETKCVIFPKGKTTWEGFVPPCQFHDGDIVATDSGRWLGIIKNKYYFEYYTVHCAIDYTFNDIFYRCGEYRFSRLATKEEKAKLFQAIKDNGYKWNEETKTLEKIGYQYPKTYEECCGVFEDNFLNVICLSDDEKDLFYNIIKIKRCRDAYWRLYGEQMGLGKPWKPDFLDDEQPKFCLYNSLNNVLPGVVCETNEVLVFPTEEMRDAFYENFKDLIEKCKELL